MDRDGTTAPPADRPGRPIPGGLHGHVRATLLAGLVLTACGESGGTRPPEPAPAGAVSFAVFGDGPYDRSAERRVDLLLRDVAEASPDFFLHVGDIDTNTCTDASYERRRRQLESLPESVPVVYTPGDNEWTDCTGTRMDPLERLTSLRRVFFTGEWAERNRRLPGLVSQDSVDGLPYPEHVRFEVGPVVVATAHIVGSRNGMRRFRGRTAAHDSAVEARTAAALAWIRSAFDRARAVASPVLVVAFHGAPFRDPEFAPLRATLAREAAAYDGRVLLAHGDFHDYTFDRPLTDPTTGATVENVTRLETFGDPDVGWVHVIVDTAAAEPIAVRPYRCGGRWRAALGVALPEHCGLMR